jgi:hypothetical protein
MLPTLKTQMYRKEKGTQDGNSASTIKKLTIRELLKPHATALMLGFVAVAGEGIANLLQPWPLKVVLDSVLRSPACMPCSATS